MHILKALGLLLVIGMLIGLAAVLASRASRISLDWLKPKPLMTDNEREFFHRLERALPGHHVFPQVAFAAFLTHDSKVARNARMALRNRFDRKMADFVVCERETLSIVALIELDDRSHRAIDDQLRDQLTEAAGYRTIRFMSKQKPTEAEIARLLGPKSGVLVNGLTVDRAARTV
jgi:hypothetical protein